MQLWLYSKTFCCYDNKSKNFKRKALNKVEDCGHKTMVEDRRALEKAVNLNSTNKIFRIVNHTVVTNEQKNEDFK